jgi:hypothetical protein
MRRQSRFGPRWLVTALEAILILALCASVARAVDDGRATIAGRNGGPEAKSIRAAVDRAIPLLVTASTVVYPKKRDCFSCHNQAVPAVALHFARTHGFAVGAETLRLIAEHTVADLNGAIDDYRKGTGQPGGVIRAGYALWALEAAGWTPDEATTAVVGYLADVSKMRDPWQTQANRPPSESSPFTATALALRALDTFGTPAPARASTPNSQKQQTGQSQLKTGSPWPARALRWLSETKPRETEDRVFRLWGLKYAGATKSVVAAAVGDLLKAQHADGGWSQLDDLAPAPQKGESGKSPGSTNRAASVGRASDAYATGSALVALHHAGGMATVDPAYRRGLDFLVRTQRADGSWYVKSRSRPFQTYFESGFPHGVDQFISVAASGWAVAALALACPAP